MNEDSSKGGTRREAPRGTTANGEKEIIQELFFDEKEYLAHLKETVQRAVRYFKIEPQTGRVVLTDDAKRFRVPDQVRLLLAGRYFAWKYGVIASDKMNYREIASDLNRPASGVSAELTDLVREGDVARDDGGLYSMPFHRIDGTLRELEVAKPRSSAAPDAADSSRKTGGRRVVRQRDDPVLKEMLEKGADLSPFGWVPKLKTAMDKGLAALLIASDVYGRDELTSTQMATFLTRLFPVTVTRGAIHMGLARVRGTHVHPIPRGKEVGYKLLPYGKDYITKVAGDIRAEAQS